MVKFFNQKEEVIQIELTPYGKDRLSKGLFYPKYYAFYDNDILYDGTQGNITEIQNQIVKRIQDNTPRLRTWASFTGSEQPVVSLRSTNDENEYNKVNDANTRFFRFMGTNSPWSDFFPSWDITVAQPSNVLLSDTAVYQTSLAYPLLSSSLEVTYATESAEDPNAGSIYFLESNEKIVLDIQELNTLFKLNGNFDIEIFKMDSQNELKALGFINHESAHASQLTDQTSPYVLVDTLNGTEENLIEAFPILDNTYVEYYFNVFLDREVQGVEMPSNSTLYKRNIDTTMGDLCEVVDTTSGRDG